MTATTQLDGEAAPAQLDAERGWTGGSLTLRCQQPQDRSRVEKLCPRDQERQFVGRWLDPHTFVIEPAPVVVALKAAPADDDTGAGQGEGGGEGVKSPAGGAGAVDPDAAERARLTVLTDANLQALAAERSVKWDKKASRETLVERILQAGKRDPGGQ